MMNVLAMILAGGKGERLYPLTRDRAKPGVPFGAHYRIIDFTLSNCVNSGLRKIVILTQYKSFSLDQHIQLGWNFFSHPLGEYIHVIPAQQRVSEDWYLGTADAVYQNIYTLEQERPDVTLILSGDHVYRMDYRPLVNFHLIKGADLTVGAIPMPKEMSEQFGVMVIDENYRIIGFQEKPKKPKTIPGNDQLILASMGIYVFTTKHLVKRVVDDAKRTDSAHDFGKNVIPSMVGQDRVYAYPFLDEKTGDAAYWRDVGTIEAYWEAHMDLVSRDPNFSLFAPSWPVFTHTPPTPPAKIIAGEGDGRGISDSIISGGSFVIGARVEKSVIGRNVTIHEGSEIFESVILDNVTVNRDVRLKRVIIDKGVSIPAGRHIGFSPEEDKKYFDIQSSGIVVVPKMMRFD
jgi:glucose-1-phosphate adenylyltransferase